MPAVAGIRKDTHRVTVSVDGVDTGVWDKRNGGGVDSDSKTYKPGGMAEPRPLGGQQSVDDVALARLYDHDLFVFLLPLAGRGAVVVTSQPLDVNGAAYGAPIVWRGVLKKVQPGEVDSQSNDEAMLEIEVTASTVTAA